MPLYVVLGYSISGKSVARYLKNKGFSVAIHDDHPAKQGEIIQDGYDIYQHNDESFAKMDFLVVSPGIGNSQPIIADALKFQKPLMLDIDFLLKERQDCQFIAITGTNGKSTTTKLMKHALQTLGYSAQMGGNIGIAAMDLIHETADYIVLELSSYQLERMGHFDFSASVLLNLSFDHLERHGTMARYAEVKGRVFGNHYNFIGVDDSFCADIYRKNPHLTGFSGEKLLDKGIGWQGHDLFDNGQKVLTLPKGCPLQGLHNQQNIAAVWGILSRLFKDRAGLADDFVQALLSFEPLPHRQQWVGEVRGVSFINDSKATNVASALLSLQNFENIHWLAGGQLKEGDDYPLLAQACGRIKCGYFYGAGRNLLRKSLNSVMENHMVATMQEAFHLACQNAAKGDVILLAPAGASFDQFKNFEDRGNQFMELVRGLG